VVGQKISPLEDFDVTTIVSSMWPSVISSRGIIPINLKNIAHLQGSSDFDQKLAN
jgi:hypothetical protein